MTMMIIMMTEIMIMMTIMIVVIDHNHDQLKNM